MNVKKDYLPDNLVKTEKNAMKTILIDAGHGITTRGKHSPDGRYAEWLGNRRLARRIVELAVNEHLDCRLLFDSDADLPLSARVALANNYDPDTTVLVSVHSNAAGDGSRWQSARGFSAFVAPVASRLSRELAAAMVALASREGLAGNRCVPPEGYWTANLAICRRTACPALLTENLFHDNREDLDILLSATGVERLARIHVEALKMLLQ